MTPHPDASSDANRTRPAPLLSKLKFWLSLWLIKIVVHFQLRSYRRNIPAAQAPTYIKRYSVRPALECRVFVPRSYVSGGELPPLFIDIHGGGFVFANPAVDDDDNAILAHEHGICVVSIEYSRSPTHYFPTSVEDCAALIQAILDDDSLPADQSKVAVGGYSAGGNLALAATQLSELSRSVKAVVAYYPVLDFVATPEEKQKRSKLAPGKDKDLLSSFHDAMAWGYVPTGTDRRNPLISPSYAERGSLPPKIMFVGCEFDMLCPEAKDMAERLGESETGQRADWDGDDSWEKGVVRWHLMKGVEHGFNGLPVKDPVKRAINEQKQKEMHAAVAEWLFRQVYV